jgi:nicotinamide riboside kinase
MLAESLAKHFGSAFVPEYAREYINNLDRPYTQEDILNIAREQARREDEIAAKAEDFIFCDTELIVTKIWSEVKYGSCDPWILDSIENRKYDLYLLCYIDIPWEDDPQREHPHMREKLFQLYFDELAERGYPFVVVSGLGDERLANAVREIEKRFIR